MTDDELKELVLTLEEKVWNAVVEKDGTALGDLFADNYIEITVDGKRIEKSEIVALCPQVDEIEQYALDFERVVVLGTESAVLNYHLTLDGRSRISAGESEHQLAACHPRFNSTEFDAALVEQHGVAGSLHVKPGRRYRPAPGSRRSEVAGLPDDCSATR